MNRVLAPKPLKGDSKTKSGRFYVKVDFFCRTSATKFLCAKTVSDV